ncbi:MAG: hypothetical protein U5L04_00305 [Trueperaceae bacterium]|nr:hypothetical protein [Trueperaceae bacterium]
MIRRPLVVSFVLLALLTSCLPAADTRPEIMLLNAPSDTRVDGLATAFEAALREQPSAYAYQFTFRPAARFQERHRNMAPAAAPLQAAFAARALGSDYPVMVSAPVYERHVDTFFGNRRRIETAASVRAIIIDPTTAEVVATFVSPVYRRVRVVSIDPAHPDLAPLAEDPDLAAVTTRALYDLAPVVSRTLFDLVGGPPSPLTESP